MLIRCRLPLLVALAVALAVGLAGSRMVRLEQDRHERIRHGAVLSQVSQYRAALEGEIHASLHLISGLAAYVATQPRLEPAVVTAMLKALHGEGRHIRNIAMAPGNRLTYVYPLAGNENVVGLYYPDLADQWPAVERAMRERRPVLAGPVRLRQGGVGFIYRVPVFLAPSDHYWGMLSMVIEEQSLFERAGIAPSVGPLQLALRGRDGRGADGEVFLGDPALFADADAVVTTIQLPGGTWQLAARPDARPGEAAYPLHAGVWTLALLVGVLLFLALNSVTRRLHAEQAVRRGRDELAQAQRIAGVGSWVINLRSQSLSWSDETYRIFGVAPGTPLTLDDFAARLHPDDRERVLAAWAAAVDGAPYALEHRIVVDGQTRWVDERARIERDAAGQPVTGLGTVLDITARKQAELERQDAEERFAAFMDHTSAIAWIKDEQGRYVYINREYQRRFQARPEDWYGRTDAELWPAEVAAGFRANDLAVLAAGQPLSMDEPAAEPGGRVSLWHNVKFSFRDAAGRRYVAGIGIDVTQSREEGRLLREAQRIAHVGNWMLDPDVRRLVCSDEALHILDLVRPDGELAYDDFIAAVHAEDRARVASAFEMALRRGVSLDITHRLTGAQGVVKYVHQRGERAHEGAHGALRMHGTLQDVTLEKLAEEALRESELRFRTVADYYYDWEYWRGPDGEFLYLSPSCERVTGYSQYELITDPGLVERMIHPDDRERVVCHMRDQGDGGDHSLDFRIITKAGEVRWLAHGCRPVQAADGSFQGRRVSNRDITDRKLAEHALSEAKDRLELALDASQLSIWELDIAAGTVAFDAAWAAAADLFAGEDTLRNDRVSTFVHVDDRERLAAAVRATFRGETPGFHVEIRFRTLGGGWKWLRCSGKVVERNAAGRALRAIGTALDVTQRKATEEAVKQMAFHDQLTQLPNRRLLEDRLQQAIARAQRERQGLSLLFIDIDKFKPVNDAYGHDVGDWLLQRIAERMKTCLRESDTVARVGGDEFVVLLPAARTADDAALVAEKIRLAIEQPFDTAEGHRLQVSSSIGVAVYPEHAASLRELLRVGDDAMYRAKTGGRNAVTVFQRSAQNGAERPA